MNDTRAHASRSALVIASDTYNDERLRKLRAPAIDAEHLARVLGDGAIGGFDVSVSLNEPEHVVRRKLAAFFDHRGLDDVLVLHLSCHGVKDEDGRLYFATPDTQLDQLDATSLPADFINRQMTRSRSRRIVLFLDCCYSGAFARGMFSRSSDKVDLVERFEGRGRIVLTASSAMEYSFEGDELTGKGSPSVFTSAVIEGLATGEADRDRDGYVSVDELYNYAYDRVRNATPSQTPGKWVFDVQGDFFIARSNRPPEPIDPLSDLRPSIASPFTNVRLGAVEELQVLLDDADPTRAAAAAAALDELADSDDVTLVRTSADRARRLHAAAKTPPSAAPEVRTEPASTASTVPLPSTTMPPEQVTPAALPPVGMQPEPAPQSAAASPPKPARPAAGSEPPPPNWVPPVALVAAIAILTALPVPLLTEGLTTWNLFAVAAPIELLAAAAILLLGSGAVRNGRLPASAAAGRFLVVGLLISSAGLGLVKFAAEDLDGLATALALGMTAGGLAALAVGAACWRTVAELDDRGTVEPAWLVTGLIATILAIAALFVVYDGYSSLWLELSEGDSAEFFFEPAVAALIMGAAALTLSVRRRMAAAALVTVGGLTAVHYVGLLIAAAFAIGEPGGVGPAGLIGVLAGALASFAGQQIQRSLRG